MKFIHIGIKDIYIILKDRKAFIGLVAMPLLLITILGFALTPYFKNRDVETRISVAVVNMDKGFDIKELVKERELASRTTYINIGNMLENSLKSKESRKSIRVIDTDEKHGEKMVKDSDAAAAVIIPSNFTKNYFGGRKVNIFKVLGDKSQSVKLQIIREICSTFSDRINSVYAGFSAAFDYAGSEGISRTKLFLRLEKQVRLTDEYNMINFDIKKRQNKREMSAFQYYAAAMMVMFIMFTGSRGVYSIFVERDNGTFSRMTSMGVSHRDIVLGKFLGIVLTGILQVGIIILFTAVAFKVSWGSSIPGLIWVSLASVVCISGFGVLIATFAKDRESADNLINIGITVMSMIGGSFIPIYSMPPIVRFVSKFTINGETIRGYAAIMQGLGFFNWFVPGIYLCASGAIFLVIGMLKLHITD